MSCLLAVLSPRSHTNSGRNAGHFRFFHPREDVVRMLLEAGMRTNDKAEMSWTCLMTATVGGHVGIVEDLLEAGARVDTKNKEGCTALFMAASEGKAGIQF